MVLLLLPDPFCTTAWHLIGVLLCAQPYTQCVSLKQTERSKTHMKNQTLFVTFDHYHSRTHECLFKKIIVSVSVYPEEIQSMVYD